MAPNVSKKVTKHKLVEEKSEAAKKPRLSSSPVPKGGSSRSMLNDSGIGYSVSSKKKVNNVSATSRGKTTAKRRLIASDTSKASRDPSAPIDVSNMDVTQILALGENNLSSVPEFVCNTTISDSEESDWEEVAEKPELTEPVIPEQGVNITLEGPIVSFKRKKREIDLEGEIRRQLKRRQKEIQELKHKVHLLCWIAHAKYINSTLNSEVLLKESRTLISSKNIYPPKHADLDYLERIVKIFHKHVTLNEDLKSEGDLIESLQNQFKSKVSNSKKSLVYMFVVFLRGVGLKVRLIMNLVTVPLRPSGEKSQIDSKGKAGKDTNPIPSTSKSPQSSSLKTSLVSNLKVLGKIKTESSSEEMASTLTPSPSKGLKANLVSNLKVITPPSTAKISNERQLKKLPPSKCNAAMEKRKRKASENKVKEPEVDDSDDEPLSKHFKEPRKVAKVVVKEAGPSKGKKSVSKKPAAPIPKKEKATSDDDFKPKASKEPPQKKKIDRRVLSSDDEVGVQVAKKIGQDVWVEVFLEAEEKWITVDVIRQKVHCVQLLQVRATQPVVYVLACNNDLTLKDVTKRYTPQWHSDTRKKRVAEAWWDETLWPYIPASTAQEKEEDEDIAKQLHDMPLPTSISEFKCHPLYALKRHLLKFEGIYPPDAPTLGFIRGEPVYGRECVVTLRSRDIWFKEARVVRLQETPYKIVKSRPKYDKMTGDFKKDLPLELFGVWQTEDYIPPIAVDGKVPRNEYGNVDLFKPCMLPGGTVHLQIPALNRVARKLGIDCAPAVVGFEFHAGGSHPVHDGFVVCEEFKEQLLDAWNKEIDESARRAEERLEKRVYGNWRRLIRGLLIRENLKMKYSFGMASDDESPKPSTSQDEPAPVAPKKNIKRKAPGKKR